MCPRSSLHTARKSQSGPKGSCSPNIRDLCFDQLYFPTFLQAPPPPHKVTSRRLTKELVYFYPPFIFFSLFPFLEPDLKYQNIQNNCIGGENYERTVNAQEEAQKRPKKTLNLYFGLNLSTETDYNNQKNKNRN